MANTANCTRFAARKHASRGASADMFLLSDAASFVTGEHVQVTGGARF